MALVVGGLAGWPEVAEALADPELEAMEAEAMAVVMVAALVAEARMVATGARAMLAMTRGSLESARPWDSREVMDPG